MLFMVSCGRHSVFMEYHAGPVGNKVNHTSQPSYLANILQYWKLKENLTVNV